MKDDKDCKQQILSDATIVHNPFADDNTIFADINRYPITYSPAYDCEIKALKKEVQELRDMITEYILLNHVEK